jgi:molecular chaperone GrpE
LNEKHIEDIFAGEAEEMSKEKADMFQKDESEVNQAAEASRKAESGNSGASQKVDSDQDAQGTEETLPQDKSNSLQKELDQTKDQLMRLSADFDNFRKRTQREKEEWGRYAAQSLFEKLLPVLDGLDNATAAVETMSAESKKTVEGFMMLQKQLLDILNQEGLKEIPALGESFDPNIHEAIMQVAPEAGEKDNQIVMVLRKGYMYRERVLRASMVKVAKED